MFLPFQRVQREMLEVEISAEEVKGDKDVKAAEGNGVFSLSFSSVPSMVERSERSRI